MRRLWPAHGNRRSREDGSLARIGLLQELLLRACSEVVSRCGTIAIGDHAAGVNPECVGSEGGEGRAMATSRVVHGRRGADECYSGRVFGDRNRYLSTDSDSRLNLLI
jgi:hypothetical protein